MDARESRPQMAPGTTTAWFRLIPRRRPGVKFAIHRISFGRRMELSRRVREISRKAEFLEAGTELHEKIEANILAQEIDAMYLQWGLVSIEGLIIDGEPATRGCSCWKKGRKTWRARSSVRSKNSAG